MKTTWKVLLAGTAALAIVACTPAETEDTAAEAEAAPAEVVDAGEEMMAEDAATAEAPEATTEGADEETPQREEHGNPAGPVTTQAE